MQRKQNNMYRKKPLAVFENGTRIYAPSATEPRLVSDAFGCVRPR